MPDRPAEPAARPPRALPAAPPPLTLDALTAAATRAQERRQPPPRPAPSVPFTLPRSTPSIDSTPVALVLPITVTTCACGHVSRSCGPPLARFDHLHARTNTTEFRRATSLDTHLPRETKLLTFQVPFCERCF